MRIARLLMWLAAAGLLFLVVGYWNATRPPIVIEQEIELPGLAPGSSLRVLLFADIHQGMPDMPRKRVESIVAAANALKPDLMLLAGDYHGGKLFDFLSKPHVEPAIEPLAKLRAPLGVVLVLGNHDNMHWTQIVMARHPSLKLLINAHLDVGPLVVAGANSVRYHSNVPGALEGVGPEKPVLVLMHEGDWLADVPKPAGLSVHAFAGHTHGGQIVLPFIGPVGALLLPDTKCLKGACTINGWPLFVTSGVGTSWVPLRYGVRPEMVLLKIRPPAGNPER